MTTNTNAKMTDKQLVEFAKTLTPDMLAKLGKLAKDEAKKTKDAEVSTKRLDKIVARVAREAGVVENAKARVAKHEQRVKDETDFLATHRAQLANAEVRHTTAADELASLKTKGSVTEADVLAAGKRIDAARKAKLAQGDKK